jgi:predicted kinase
MLIILSGLPGAGKTTIARELARELAAVYLRTDSIEQAIRGSERLVEGEGYDVAYSRHACHYCVGVSSDLVVYRSCTSQWIPFSAYMLLMAH